MGIGGVVGNDRDPDAGRDPSPDGAEVERLLELCAYPAGDGGPVVGIRIGDADSELVPSAAEPAGPSFAGPPSVERQAA